MHVLQKNWFQFPIATWGGLQITITPGSGYPKSLATSGTYTYKWTLKWTHIYTHIHKIKNKKMKIFKFLKNPTVILQLINFLHEHKYCVLVKNALAGKNVMRLFK